MTSNAMITPVLKGVERRELCSIHSSWPMTMRVRLRGRMGEKKIASWANVKPPPPPPPPPPSPQRSCAFVPHCPGHNGHNGQAAGGQQGEEEERGELLLHWAGHHSLEPSYFNCPEDNNLKFVFHSNCTKSSLDQCILLLKVDVSLRSQSTSGWSKFFQVGINWVEMLAMQSFFCE